MGGADDDKGGKGGWASGQTAFMLRILLLTSVIALIAWLLVLS